MEPDTEYRSFIPKMNKKARQMFEEYYLAEQGPDVPDAERLLDILEQTETVLYGDRSRIQFKLVASGGMPDNMIDDMPDILPTAKEQFDGDVCYECGMKVKYVDGMPTCTACGLEQEKVAMLRYIEPVDPDEHVYIKKLWDIPE